MSAPLPVWVLALIVLAAGGAGCSALSTRPGEVLARQLGDLMPHGDRDHFVYRSEKRMDDAVLESNLVVEHFSSLPAPGEFEVTESIDGMRSGDSRWRVDERGISLLSEDLEGLGVRLEYDPPLLVFPQPLLAGEHRAAATGAASSLVDGAPVGSFRTTLLLESSRTRTNHPLAAGAPAVSLRVTRSLHGPGGALVLKVDTVNAEGVGEVESVARLDGAPFVIRRSLVCGFIQGRAVGRCED